MPSTDKVKKIRQFGCITEYFCATNLTSGFVKVSEFFSTVALADVNDGGTPYMGISPGRTRPCTHRPKQERRHQRSLSGCTADKRFINKTQFDAGFAHCLILKDGAVPAIKDPSHDSELQMVSETAPNVCVLLVIVLNCSKLFSSAQSAPPPGALLFPERIVKLYIYFISDKTKDFMEIWRMQYYSIGTQD